VSPSRAEPRPADHLSSEPTATGSQGFFGSLGWRRSLLVFLLVLVVHGASPSVQVADSRLSVPVAYAVLKDGSLSIDGVPSTKGALEDTDYDVVERDGRTLPFFPWPPMLLALPGVALAQVAGVEVGDLRPSSPNESWPVELPTAALIVALTSVVMALVALEVARGSRRANLFAIACALTFAFGTGAWSTASRALWQHTPSMLCWSLALLAALRSRERRGYLWVLGASLATAFTMRPTAAVPIVIVGLWAAWEHRVDAWRVLAAAGLVAVPFVAVNVASYGEILPPYYAGTRVGTEAAIGFSESLGVHLFSPSRGLLVYTPIVLLAPLGLWMKKQRGTLDSLDGAVAATLVVHWLVLASYGSTGGSSYGSRFFTEALPFLLYLAMPVGLRVIDGEASRILTVSVSALVALSVVMTAPGALLRSAYCWSATPTFVDDSPERVWDWSDPQFARPIERLRSGDSVRSVVAGACDTEEPASALSSRSQPR
jgi:hypothetical protein